MDQTKQIFLAGKSIYLRGVEETDLSADYQSWFNDAEVCQFNSHHRFPNYRQDMEEYYRTVIKGGRHLILAIVDKASDHHVGNIALQDINPIDRSAEFAIIIGDKKFWGRGIGQEAGQLVIEHGFKALNLHRLYCGTSVENAAMQKLALNLGFEQEGIAREALFKNGSYQDIILYGILNNEPKK